MGSGHPSQGNLAPVIVIGSIDDATLVIESEGIASNDNDTTFPTSASVKDYSDTNSVSPTLTDGNILVGNGSNVATSVNPSGDIDVTNAGVFSISSGVVTLGDISNAAKAETIALAASDETTALTTGIKNTFYMPYAFTLTDIKATVVTAPTGAGLIVDVHEAGTTIMTTDKLDIDVSEFSTETAGTAPAITDTTLAADAKIEIEVDQIGSTVAGAGLKVYLIGHQT